MPVKAPELLPGGWRALDDFGSWDHADMFRTTTVRENPTLDVRVEQRGSRVWVDVREAVR